MYRILYYPLFLIIIIISLLPLRVHYLFSSVLAFLLHRVFRYRVSIVYINISRAFPEKNYREIHRLVTHYYRYVSDVIVESIWAITRSEKRISKIIHFDELKLAKEMGVEEKMVVLMMAHQGNWELCTDLYNVKENLNINLPNEKIFIVYKKLKSKFSNLMMNMIRGHNSKNCTMIDSSKIIKYMLKNRGGNGLFVFLSDQNPIIGAEFFVEFLGLPTLMIKGPEFVARKLGLPVMFGYADRIARGNYVLKTEKICDDASTLPEGYVTWKYTKLLEESIRKNPINWLWSHKRWKRKVNKDEILKFDNN